MPAGKTVSGSPGTRAIDQFGRRAVATHGDQGPQTALGEQSIGLAGNFIEIREDRDFKSLLAEKFDQARNAILGRPCPCLRVNRHDDVSEFRR